MRTAATISTFLTKFLFAMTFIVPVILFALSTAIVISMIWGLSMLSILSYIIAKSQSEPPWKIGIRDDKNHNIDSG